MVNGRNRLYFGASFLVSSVPLVCGLYAVGWDQTVLGGLLLTLSLIMMGFSTFLFLGYKTYKHTTPLVFRMLRIIHDILQPLSVYLLGSTIVGPLISAAVRSCFFFSFVLLLMSDRMIRGVLRFFVGRHPTQRNYSIINAMDPTMTMFDDSIPPTQNLENSELFKKRKQLTGHSSDVDALTHVLKRPRYSLPLAYTLAVASKLVYEDTAVIKYELEKAGFDVERTFRPIAYHNVCAFIVEKDDDILLVFRGTNPLNIGNYLTNINIAMGEVRAPWGSMGEVHKGFWEAMGDPRPACATPAQAATVRIELSNTSLYRTIMSTLQAAIKIVQFLTKNLFQHVAEPVDNSYLGHDSDIRSYSMYAQGEQYIMSLINHSHSEKLVPDAKIKLRNGIQRPKRLFITGHSLGGALGTIFLAKMVQSDSPLLKHFAGLYTYGQPKIGSAEFSRIFRPQLTSKIFHHVYNNDIVARVPFWLKYDTSPGTLVFIDSRYNITLYPPNPYTNEPVPLRPISYLHLSGLLNIHVIRRLISETWMRILFRAVFPFFFNDHFPSDYCHSLRNGTVNWVIVGTSGLHGGDEDEQRRLLTTSHRRCSMVDIKNDASRV